MDFVDDTVTYVHILSFLTKSTSFPAILESVIVVHKMYAKYSASFHLQDQSTFEGA